MVKMKLIMVSVMVTLSRQYHVRILLSGTIGIIGKAWGTLIIFESFRLNVKFSTINQMFVSLTKHVLQFVDKVHKSASDSVNLTE